MSLNTAAAHVHNTKVGSCPHGLPQGACPICSGMAGGNSTSKRNIPRNVGEMTYNECAAIGAMLKAQKNAKEMAKLQQENYVLAMQNFQKAMQSAHQKLVDFAQTISNSMPKIIAKPLNFVLTKVIGGAINLIKNIPVAIGNFIQTISLKLTDISEKLTAIYGEIKSAISKTISETFKHIKKKLKSIFFIFGADDVEEEEKKVDEVKKTFNLKTLIQKLTGKEKDTQEDDS